MDNHPPEPSGDQGVSCRDGAPGAVRPKNASAVNANFHYPVGNGLIEIEIEIEIDSATFRTKAEPVLLTRLSQLDPDFDFFRGVFLSSDFKSTGFGGFFARLI